MATINGTFAQQFANDWIQAWNSHNLDRVLAHYEDDFTFQSPMITVFTGNPAGQLQGKDAVRAYWSKALEKLPHLHFELIDILLGPDCLTLYYRGHRGLVAEVFFFGSEDKVTRAAATYSINS